MPIRDEPPSAWVEVSPQVRLRRMIEADGTAVIMYRINPGTRFAVHSHRVAELGVMLSGRGQATIGGESRMLEPGASFYIPPGVPHEFIADRSGPVLMLNITVPVSTDADGFSADRLQSLTAKITAPQTSELVER